MPDIEKLVLVTRVYSPFLKQGREGGNVIIQKGGDVAIPF